MALHSKSLAYAATSLAATLMHSVFNFYYVKIYTQRFHVTQAWFQAAQVVFLLWNAVNDPLFGYLQDNYSGACVRTRRHSILYGAPLFALSFLVVWVPWADYELAGGAPDWLCGVQLMVGLCFYDATFTFSLLAHCSLFTEMSSDHAARIRLVRYSQFASLVGSGSVFLVNFTSHNADDYTSFLYTNFAVAIVACVCMVYTGLNATTQYDDAPHDPATALKTGEPVSMQRKASEFGMLTQTLQLLRQGNFLAFVSVNFLHIYHAAFLANFTGVFCDRLVTSDYLSSTQRSVYYGCLFIMPQVVVILGTTVVQRVGYFRIARTSFWLKILLGCLLYIIGPRPYALLVFFLLQTVGEECIGTLFCLCVSDIIDQDMALHGRRRPISSMVYGTNALVTKPAISFAPMFTVFVLSFSGYERLQASGPLANNVTNSLADSAANSALSAAMFHLACVTPIVTGVIELIAWSRYTIRNTHRTISKYVET